MVLGEPLKACAHKDEVVCKMDNEGGVVTETCAMAVLVQEVGAVTIRV